MLCSYQLLCSMSNDYQKPTRTNLLMRIVFTIHYTEIVFTNKLVARPKFTQNNVPLNLLLDLLDL